MFAYAIGIGVNVVELQPKGFRLARYQRGGIGRCKTLLYTEIEM